MMLARDIENTINTWKDSISLESPIDAEKKCEELYQLLGLYPLVRKEITSPMQFFRVRPYEGLNLKKISDFSYPPNPNLGRCNMPGFPVFYASTEMSTALKETGIKEGERAYLSVWNLKPQGFSPTIFWQTERADTQHMIDLSNEITDAWHDNIDNPNYKAEVQDWLSVLYRKICELIILNEDHKSSAVFCHNLIYNKKSDAIYYPDQEQRGNLNIAMSPKMADTLKFYRVYDICITPSSYKPTSGLNNLGIGRVGYSDDSVNIQWEFHNCNKHDIERNTFLEKYDSNKAN